jgi:hypothetical protein
MGIQHQRIDIGFGIEKIRRNVYDVRPNPAWKLETGYVRYDNNRVPVWRPQHAAQPGNAFWPEGLWRNIYDLVMPLEKDRQDVRYQTDNYPVSDDQTAVLPKVEVRLTFLLREHLKQTQG